MAKRKRKPTPKRQPNFLLKGLLISLLFHSIAFGTLGLKGCGKDGGGAGKDAQVNGSEEDKGEIVAKQETQEEPTEVEIKLVPKDSIPIPKSEPKKKAPIAEAKDGFGGIGVVYSSLDGTISEVPAGYPAARAGILPGDQIISPRIDQIRGDPGTPIELAIRRGNTIHYITLIREFIPTTGITPEGNLKNRGNP